MPQQAADNINQAVSLFQPSPNRQTEVASDLAAALSGGAADTDQVAQVAHRLAGGGLEWLMNGPMPFDVSLTLSAATVMIPVSRSEFSLHVDDAWHSHPQTAPVACSFVPEGTTLRIRQQDPVAILWLQLSPRWLEDLSARADCQSDLRQTRLLGFAHPDLVTLASAARNQLTARSPLSPLFGECLASAIMLYVLDRLSKPKVLRNLASSRTDRVARSVAYIDSNVSKAITIKELAAEASMSPYHFARSFKEVVGVPPHRYVIQRRIEHAKTLLHSTKLSIAQIAFECGFSSQSHLTSAFRTETGFTPLRYRQSVIDE